VSRPILLEKSNRGADVGRRRTTSTLPTVSAWGKAGFPAEKLRELAGIRKVDVKRNFNYCAIDQIIHFREDFVRGMNVRGIELQISLPIATAA
jgi:hypothetical protein